MKLTAKEIKKKYQVISLGYAQMQELLAYKKRLGYTTSQHYGWRSDNYLIDGVIISTGYSSVSGIRVDRDITDKYVAKYRKLRENPKLNYNDISKKVDKMLSDFVAAVLNK